MADATYVRGAHDNKKNVAAAVASGELHQLADGRAGYMVGLNSATTGEYRSFKTDGIVTVTKATGWVGLDGGRLFWDHSNNNATFRKVNDRDFYIGTIVGDAASGDTTIAVNLNVQPRPTIDLLRDGFLSVATGTQALGGFLPPQTVGGSIALSITATNEAQCVDALSVDRVALASNPIAEFVVRIGANGSTLAVDITFGLANGTSTTDADAITESAFFHIDGGSTAILAESDDGTTEVAATDTTTTFTAGSAVANRKELWLDARDPSNVKYYVDGVEVLSATANLGNIALATGPLGLLAHVEKSSSTATAGPIYIDRAELRTAEQ